MAVTALAIRCCRSQTWTMVVRRGWRLAWPSIDLDAGRWPQIAAHWVHRICARLRHTELETQRQTTAITTTCVGIVTYHRPPLAATAFPTSPATTADAA
jgi:hypothetical protein